MEYINDLLEKKVPAYRQAYSDRTCWLMACLSELAYIRFNEFLTDSKVKNYFLKKINSLIDDNRVASLTKLIDAIGYDHNEEMAELQKEIGNLKFELVKTFDKNGTQAILVKSKEFIALAFRGTEPTSIKDIKTDCSASLTVCDSGGKIHQGFNEAFLEVAEDIENELKKPEHKGRPLFITGHSLGGALATVAAKKLQYKTIAACYSFGAPRSANENWAAKMKTPIYRIVNAADCVTMLPASGPLIDVTAMIVGLLFKPIKAWLLEYFGDYSHSGNMRYLTNCSKGNYDGVQLLYEVSFLRRFFGWFKKQLSWKKIMSDHSISIYRKKLMIIARRRNL